ncbi:MAG: efflux RND transporter periplasmic adaptor subunit, partial [Desulfobacterales bacterium]|nr:efflux RND transporter periplasmic adaptor subunit [Desulfobacterales bacterium]
VAAIKYKVGDYVAADTPIISLDENDPKNISQVKLLRSVYEDALKEYQRYDSLFNSGGISADVMDKMALKLKSARTNLETARTTVHLTSPISGTLMSLYVRERENAEPGKTLAMVSTLDRVRVVAAVSDRDVAELSVGQLVKLTTATGTQLKGKVERISLGANTKSGLFDLEMVLNNRDRLLKVGTYVTTQVRVFLQEKAIYVESACLLRDFDGQDFLFQVEDNKALKKVVKKISENDKYTLLEELDTSLPVVISGKNLLKNGAKLRILNAGR